MTERPSVANSGDKGSAKLNDVVAHGNVTAFGQFPLPWFRRFRFGQGRDRTGLENYEFISSQRPLDIHRIAVQVLNLHSQPHEIDGFTIGEHRRAPLFLRYRPFFRTAPKKHGHHLLVSRLATEYMVQRFIHNKRVGSHHPTHHRLAQPPGGVD